MAQLKDLTVAGQSTLSGLVNINNSLNVTGTVTITKATDADVDANNGPALIVGGKVTSNHIEIDNNEILAKSNSTTETSLHLGTTTSNVHIGQDTKGGVAQPIYLNNGVITACSSTVGDTNKPVYLNNGVITACSNTIGDTNQPVYISNGTITVGSTYAGGTKVTLNGEDKGTSTATFYAPTSIGDNGKVLKSDGTAVYWGNDNNTWQANTSSQAGYVTAGGASNANKVWKCNSSGNPEWGTDNDTTVYLCKNVTYSSSVPDGNASNTYRLIMATRAEPSNTSLPLVQPIHYHTNVALNPSTGALKATSFNAVSDSRLKENLLVFIPQHSILDLPIYQFDFIDGAKNQIGCMAQDLQKICPEIIDEDSSTGYLSINESKIVYLLIDEVKKLKAEIQALKGE